MMLKIQLYITGINFTLTYIISKQLLKMLKKYFTIFNSFYFFKNQMQPW